MKLLVLCWLCLHGVDVIVAARGLKAEDTYCQTEALPWIAKEFSEYMDQSAKPCKDFYQYVCGGSDVEVKAALRSRTNAFVSRFYHEKVDETSDLNDVRIKAKLLYQLCMDMDRRRERGIEPLREYARRVIGLDFWKQELDERNFDWLKVEATFANYGSSGFFWMHKSDDIITIYKDSTLAYNNKTEMENIFIETGVNASFASQIAGELVKLGADLHEEPEDTSGIVVEHFTLSELKAKIPGIDWARLFTMTDTMHPTPSQNITLHSPSYFIGLAAKIAKTPPKTVANYLFLRAIYSTYLLLDGRYNEVISSIANPDGKKYDPDPEWWCRSTADYWIEDAIQSAFMKEHFSGNNKTEATELANYLRETIAEHNWPDTETTKEVSKKLGKIEFRMGYFDSVLSDEAINDNFKDLKIIPGKYYESQQNAVRNYGIMKAKFNKYAWPPGKRVMSVPMIMLQPPYYHYCYPKAINFGATGTLLAGRIVRSISKTPSCATSQWAKEFPGPSSIRFAFTAYLKWMRSKSLGRNTALPGLEMVSDKQLFFIAFAHGWCGSKQSETPRLIMESLTNVTEFNELFGCPNLSYATNDIHCNNLL